MIESVITVVFVVLVAAAIAVWVLRDHGADDRPASLERPSASRIPGED